MKANVNGTESTLIGVLIASTDYPLAPETEEHFIHVKMHEKRKPFLDDGKHEFNPHRSTSDAIAIINLSILSTDV